MSNVKESVHVLNEVFDGVIPGATEWTRSEIYGSWYREQGKWGALVTHGEGNHHEPRWEIYVWLHWYGFTEDRSNKMTFRDVHCPGIFHDPERYPEQSERHVRLGERARELADTLLAERTARPR